MAEIIPGETIAVANSTKTIELVLDARDHAYLLSWPTELNDATAFRELREFYAGPSFDRRS